MGHAPKPAGSHDVGETTITCRSGVKLAMRQVRNIAIPAEAFGHPSKKNSGLSTGVQSFVYSKTGLFASFCQGRLVVTVAGISAVCCIGILAGLATWTVACGTPTAWRGFRLRFFFDRNLDRSALNIRLRAGSIDDRSNDCCSFSNLRRALSGPCWNDRLFNSRCSRLLHRLLGVLFRGAFGTVLALWAVRTFRATLAALVSVAAIFARLLVLTGLVALVLPRVLS
jgi:hypothetical protein